jgi:hypothetical protein
MTRRGGNSRTTNAAAAALLGAALLAGCTDSVPRALKASLDAAANADDQFCTDLGQWWERSTAMAQGRPVDTDELAATQQDMQDAADRIAAENPAWWDLGDITRSLDASSSWEVNAVAVKPLQDYCTSRGMPASS